ncbi:hypothetical protein [Haloarcula japonica]|uniref:hypothetical protein n=1 Tax=Haloarcula japonica TaxID=29282 RepID=UPI0012689DFF|nr:hypothetical protein [Haloarcula japonica]
MPILLIIDPVEIGMWGYDPYTYSLPALHQFAAGQVTSIIQSGSYPATYALTSFVSTLTGNSLEGTAKYIPFTTGLIPLFLFVACRRQVGTSNALVIAVIAASTRTLLGFETKFVDEILAVTLSFFLFFLLPRCKTKSQRLIALGVLGVVAYAHHATALFLLIGLVCWRIGIPITQYVGDHLFTNHLQVRLEKTQFRPKWNTILILIMFVLTLPLYAGEGFFSLILSSMLESLSGNTSSLTGGGIDTGSSGFFSLLSTSLTASLIALTIYSLWRIINTKNEGWEVGWFVFVGILGVLYASTLVLGRVLPLDPIRLLIFIVPLLGAVAISKLPQDQASRHTIGVILIAVLLIIPNLASIPPNLLITDISHKPPIGEGHYTAQQWSASEWASTYDRRIIRVHEKGLWSATGNTYSVRRDICSNTTFVERDGLSIKDSPLNKIYTTGGVRLNRC